MEIILNIDPILASSAKLDISPDTEHEAWGLRDLAKQLTKTADFMEDLDGNLKPEALPKTDAEAPKAKPFKIHSSEKAQSKPKPKPKPKPKAVLEEPLPPKVSKAAPVKTAKPSAPKLPAKAKPRVHTASSLVEHLSDPEERGPACEPLAGYSVVPRQENGMPEFQFAHDDLLTNGIKRGRKYSEIAQDLGNSVSVGELKRRYARLNAHNRAAS